VQRDDTNRLDLDGRGFFLAYFVKKVTEFEQGDELCTVTEYKRAIPS